MAAVDGGSDKRTRVLLWTLLLVYILNFLDRQIVTILAEPISKELGLSDTQIGLMTGLAFAVVYTVLGIPIARYADRPHSNRVGIISISLGVWSAMTVLCGAAQSFVQLLLARIGVGVGEAGCSPAAMSLITDSVPAERRSSALAFYGLGVPIGSLLGGAIGGALYDAYGWRIAFYVVGAPGILLALLLPFLLRDPRRGAVGSVPATAAPKHQTAFWSIVRQLLLNRSFAMLLVAGSITSFLSYGKTTWAAILFIRNFGLSPGETGLYLGVSVGLAAVFGTWFGGWLADKWGRTDKRRILTGPALAMAIAVPILLIGYAQTDWRWAAALLILPAVFNSMYYGPTYGLVQSLVEPEKRATATSIMLLAQNLIGMGLGPLFLGMLSDWFRPMAGIESVRWALYCAAAMGLFPAYFFWRTSQHLTADLKDRQ